LQEDSIQALIDLYSRELVVDGIQEYLEELRTEIQEGQLSDKVLSERIDSLDSVLRLKLEQRLSPSLGKVINASGVIIHTNVGRAPLAPEAAEAIQEVATGYSNLEYISPEARRSWSPAENWSRSEALSASPPLWNAVAPS
jgi:L-seryl-tRNA(Ser) seleniumtransferase